MSDLQLEKKIKDLAKKKDISIRQLCQRIKVTEAGLAFSLKNDTLKVGLLKKIADELGVDISIFFCDPQKDLSPRVEELSKELAHAKREIELLKNTIADKTEIISLTKENPLYKAFIALVNQFGLVIEHYILQPDKESDQVKVEASKLIKDVGDKLIKGQNGEKDKDKKTEKKNTVEKKTTE